MNPASVPLTWSMALTSWRWDSGAALLVVGLGVGYGWACRRGTPRVNSPRVWCFAIGIAVLVAATMSMIAVYDTVLFWVRALQVLLLLFVVPFIIVLMRFFSADEKAKAATVDEELAVTDAPPGLWWESDPQLGERMGRR